MACFYRLLVASAALAAEALQQPAHVASPAQLSTPALLSTTDTRDAAFENVSTKMEELRAGIASARAESLKAVAKQKEDFDWKLEELKEKNRAVEDTNARIA